MNESPIAEVTRLMREKGVIDRMAETSINENHAYLVSVGELPELVRGKLHEKLVPAPDTTGSNLAGISARQTPEFVPESAAESPASLGSFGVLNGTLSVDRSNEERETVPEPERLELLDDDLVIADDEPTTVGEEKPKRKRGK